MPVSVAVTSFDGLQLSDTVRVGPLAVASALKVPPLFDRLTVTGCDTLRVP